VSGAMAAAIPIMYAPNFSRGLTDLAEVEVLSPAALMSNGSALSFSAVFFVLQIFTGATQAALGTAYLNESVVAWEAHLGGFVAGLIAFYLLDRKSAGN
jgi:membrane associated rhomboid family serine protease